MLENPFKPNTPIEKTSPQANQELVKNLLGRDAAKEYGDFTGVYEPVAPYTKQDELHLTTEERRVLTEARESEVWDRDHYVSWATSVGESEQWVDETFRFNPDGTVECSTCSIDGVTTLKEFPRHLMIKENLELDELISAKGLTFPIAIGGHVSLRDLASAEGLVLPEEIGEYLDLSGLVTVDVLILPKSIGTTLYLDSLREAKHITFPEYIGDDLDLRSLVSEEVLIFPSNFVLGGTLMVNESLRHVAERLVKEGKIERFVIGLPLND